ncbi:MAG: proteasome assembly chaperone family protein [Acidimicrobiales bacterium]
MSRLYDFIQNPGLDSPVLVVVLDGWIDAGLGAAVALEAITPDMPLDTVAVFDTDVLLDHRARRPTMRIEDGIQTGLTWPAIEMKAGTDPQGHDVVLLVGAEPDHSWRAFSADVVALAVEMGCRMVVGLGSYPAPTPHTRPTRVVATTAWPDLARRVGFIQGRIDVPAGVQAAIEEHAHEVGVPSVGLWAQVPHYASAMPYPAAGEALIEALNEVADLGFGTGHLADEAASARIRLDGLIADSNEHQQLVRQLEDQVDAVARADGSGLPSGEELAEELERFLRDQDSP